MRRAEAAGLALTALLSGGCGLLGLDEDEQRIQARIRELNKNGISTELINRYRKAGVSPIDVQSAVDVKATPEIIVQLKKNERLDDEEISDLLGGGKVANKANFRNSRTFNGEAYQRFSAQGFRLAVYAVAARNNVPLDELVTCIRTGFVPEKADPSNMGTFVKLAVHRIKCDDAAKIKQQEGLDVDAIINKYAAAVGTTPENRAKYLRMGFEDPQIKFLTAKGLLPDLLSDLIFARADVHSEYRGIKPLEKWEVLKLAASGKLSGDTYKQFVTAGFKPTEAVYVLREGYDLKEPNNWKAAGYDIGEMIVCKQAGIGLARRLGIQTTVPDIGCYQIAIGAKLQKVFAMYPDLLGTSSPKKR